MKKAIICFLIVLVASTFIYVSYWVTKKASYAIFYEDMVRETIQEMVKKEALK